jgi:hypothetical protein
MYQYGYPQKLIAVKAALPVLEAPTTESWVEALHAEAASCILPVGRETKMEILDETFCASLAGCGIKPSFFG